MEEDFEYIYPEYEAKYGKSSFFSDYYEEYALLFHFKIQSLFQMDLSERMRLRYIAIYTVKKKENAEEHDLGIKLLNKSQIEFLEYGRRVIFKNEHINRFIIGDNYDIDEKVVKEHNKTQERIHSRLLTQKGG